MEIGKYFGLLMQGKTEQAEELRLKGIPDKLIKYIGLDGTDTDIDEKKFETLEHDSIWFAPKDRLNDPYEFKGILIDRPKLEEKGCPATLIDAFESILDYSDYGITCFTANPTDYIPMWAYYTNNHKGFCIEYEAIKKDDIHEVLYEPERIKVASLIFQSVAAAHNAATTGSNSEIGFYINCLLQVLFIKAASWKHEKEYRIVRQLDDKSKKGKNIPINQLGMKTSKIVAGINCPTKYIVRLNQISNKLGLGNVYISQLHPDKYTIQIIRFDESMATTIRKE